MIITHTQDAHGHRRVYLGGKSSMECWIEPRDEGQGWRFDMAEAVSGNSLSADDQRAWAVHTLMKLAEILDVSPDQLAAVPFEAIAALHSSNPFDGRRVATPKKHGLEHGFMSTPPHVMRPQDFSDDRNNMERSRRT